MRAGGRAIGRHHPLKGVRSRSGAFFKETIMRMLTVKTVLPFVVVAAISMAIAAQSRPASAQEAQQTEANTAAARHQVLFNRFLSPVMTLFIADADGTRERPLVSTPGQVPSCV